MLTLLTTNMIYGIKDPIITIICFVVVLLMTFVIEIITLRKIHSSMKAIGDILPNKKEIQIFMIFNALKLFQWSVVAYSQIVLTMMYRRGEPVF